MAQQQMPGPLGPIPIATPVDPATVEGASVVFGIPVADRRAAALAKRVLALSILMAIVGVASGIAGIIVQDMWTMSLIACVLIPVMGWLGVRRRDQKCLIGFSSLNALCAGVFIASLVVTLAMTIPTLKCLCDIPCRDKRWGANPPVDLINNLCPRQSAILRAYYVSLGIGGVAFVLQILGCCWGRQLANDAYFATVAVPNSAAGMPQMPLAMTAIPVQPGMHPGAYTAAYGGQPYGGPVYPGYGGMPYMQGQPQGQPQFHGQVPMQGQGMPVFMIATPLSPPGGGLAAGGGRQAPGPGAGMPPGFVTFSPALSPHAQFAANGGQPALQLSPIGSPPPGVPAYTGIPVHPLAPGASPSHAAPLSPAAGAPRFGARPVAAAGDADGGDGDDGGDDLVAGGDNEAAARSQRRQQAGRGRVQVVSRGDKSLA